MPIGSRFTWFHRADDLRACFHARVQSSIRPSPDTIASGSSFHAFAPLQSSFFSAPAQSLSGSSIPTRALRPLRGVTVKRPQTREPPVSRSVPPAGFLNPSAVYSASHLAGVFHPATTFRIPSRSGSSLSVQSPSLIGKPLPSCRCATQCFPSEDGPTSGRPRLRGLSPHEAAFLGFGD